MKKFPLVKSTLSFTQVVQSSGLIDEGFKDTVCHGVPRWTRPSHSKLKRFSAREIPVVGLLQSWIFYPEIEPESIRV